MADLAAKALAVLLTGQLAGTVTEGRDGKLTLTYDEAWLAQDDATALSLSMPLHTRSHDDDVVRPFLWGLLPDNNQVLERWGRTYQVSASNPFSLLRHVGEDCAGAVSFCRPDRVAAIVAGSGGIEWVREEDIAERLRILRRDPAAWHPARTGQFSLAGAQAKTAMYFDKAARRWGDPWGATPTTHIFKPAVSGFDDHDLNEHLCLEAAGGLGLRAARSQVMAFDEERAIVVERYDRVDRPDGTVARVHQEDVCQALGVLPTGKYQNEGGPSPEQIIALLRSAIQPTTAADENVHAFVSALAFNWVFAGTDGHAKNYSLLLAGKQCRLAPMYDVASALPYGDMYLPKLKMAMRIGGEYRLEQLRGRHWRRFAVENQLDPDNTVALVDGLAARALGCLAAAAQVPAVQALDSDLPARLIDKIATRAVRCRDALKQN